MTAKLFVLTLTITLIATPASAITFSNVALTTGPGYRTMPVTEG
jgi:uncharacterized protein YraI